MQEFTGLGILLLLSVLFALCMLVTAFVVRPKSSSKAKHSTYECGIIPIGTPKIRYNVQYFAYAVIFLIFDVETVLLFPFAFVLNKLGFPVLIEAVVFVVILLFGLFYVIKKGVLKF